MTIPLDLTMDGGDAPPGFQELLAKEYAHDLYQFPLIDDIHRIYAICTSTEKIDRRLLICLLGYLLPKRPNSYIHYTTNKNRFYHLERRLPFKSLPQTVRNIFFHRKSSSHRSTDCCCLF
jgi:hypothetical protein